MKKILSHLIISAAAIGLVACSGEEDDIFSASAAERLNAASALYSARLTAQPNGWAMQFYPTYDDEDPNGAGYLLLCRFNKDFSVNVSGYNWPKWEQVFNTETRRDEWQVTYFQEYREDTSFWEVITDNGPVLSFNSFNSVLHYFSDPDYHETGTGFGGDYEFIVTDAPDDASYMVLKGKKRGTYNLLTPVEEGVDYATYMADVHNFQTMIFSPSNPTSCFLILGDSTYVMEDAVNGLPSIYPVGTDKVSNENFNPFLITKRGDDYYLRFRDAFTREGMKGTLQDLRYIPQEDRFVCQENGDFRIEPTKVTDFFPERFLAGHTFTLYRSKAADDMSDKMRTLMNSCSAGMKKVNKNYIFDELKLSYSADTGNAMCSFKYQKSESALDMEYEYAYNIDGDAFQLSYKDAKTDYARNIATRVADVGNLLSTVMSQQFTISAITTQFDLSRIKLTAVNDPDLWFVVYY